ncbi:MAG: hypothetical protein KGZ65_04265 [Sphingomonadales bacterium]|nr:hypothetical protein [Sphingomonadaceae bacterium]MBS3930428.1 hypothetical protein [Sphingomonadales bacterium]
MSKRISGVIFDEANVGCRVHRSYADTSGTGLQLLQAGVPGKCIRILAGLLMSSGECAVYFASGAQGSKKSGTYPLIVNQGFNLNKDDDGHFQTNKGEGLYINHGSSTTLGVTFRFILTEVEDPI